MLVSGPTAEEVLHLTIQLKKKKYKLVVEHNIWPPDMVRGNMKHFHPSIFLRIPLELVVFPVLLHP